MTRGQLRLALPRLGIYGLIVLAAVLVSTVAFVLVTDDPMLSAEEAFPEPVILDPSKRPNFVFPESVRTYDISLNRFVDRFARLCMQGRYSDFRLLLSTRRPPVLPPDFESMFNALKQVRITNIERVPDHPALAGPVYIMTAEYELEDYAARRGSKTKIVQLAITREEGNWRIGPIPSEAMAMLEAYRQRTTQPAETMEPAETTEPASEPPVQTNRPARIAP